MQKVAVVIPTHKEELDELEQISFSQCRKVLGHYPIIYAIPEGKDFAWIPEGSQVIHMPHLGQGPNHYNILLKSPQFYEPFLDYEYILIYHIDAFVFYDALEYFCSLGYDYIGAPWPLFTSWFKISKTLSRIGNGGFCLRKVKAHYDLLTNHPDLAGKIKANEDVFFSMCGKMPDLAFNVAPYSVACEFAAEVNPSRVIKKNGGHFPFGCHKWFGYNSDLFIKHFLKLGYDLRPLKNRLHNANFTGRLRQGLCDEAIKRLNRRLKISGGGYILQYLPMKKFASARVLRSPDTMKIFMQLFTEENSLADKIIFYDDLAALSNDLTVEELPHIVITLADEAPLFAEIKKRGLNYGEHVISFKQEYLNYCEKLFHKLGK